MHLLPSKVQVPLYDRNKITHGIVHIGVGAFHRAHQAVYIDDCLAAGERDWGIVGVSLRNKRTRDALFPQNNLFTLAARKRNRETLRIIGSISNIFALEDDVESIFAYLCHPNTRIVSLTVTEKGYCVNLATGELAYGLPKILHDLSDPHNPHSVPGIIVEAIFRRRRDSIAPFTVLSCDNLPSNGATTLNVLTQYSSERDVELGKFIAGELICPSTMVDRIVPATTETDIQSINEKLGLTDSWPVVTEEFSQWIIEDRFLRGRPELERCGVKFVTDVAPFEHMKLRMLNGAHSSIAAIGRIAGFSTVCDAVSNPSINRFVQMFWAEIAPTMNASIDTKEYSKELLERFANSALDHRLDQIATDASQKIPQRLISPTRELRANGRKTPMLIFAIAAWIRSCCGEDEKGKAIAVNDPSFTSWSGMPERSSSASVVVHAYLAMAAVFGEDMKRDAYFTDGLARAFESIMNLGILPAMNTLLEGTE